MSRNVNVTISMPVEMVDDLDELAKLHTMSRASYVRHLIRQAPDSPYDIPSEKYDSASVSFERKVNA